MSDADRVVCILSLLDGPERLERLAQVLREVAADGRRKGPDGSCADENSGGAGMPGAERADGGGLGADRGTQGAEHGSADGIGTGGGTGMPGAVRADGGSLGAEHGSADGTGSDGLRAFAADGGPDRLPPPEPPERVVPLREAFFAPSEAVPLDRAAGRVSAAAAGPYPPGAALVTPGERVTEELAAYLAALGPRRTFGLGPGGTLACLR